MGFFFTIYRYPKAKHLEKVLEGMTLEEVLKIMPKQLPGPEAERMYRDGDKTVYIWRYADGGGSYSRRRSVEIAFRDNLVVYKKIV